MGMTSKIDGASVRPAGRDGIPVRQTAALCYRRNALGIEVLLVKSSRGRWILPKGWPETGRSLAHTARTEAWEEAGVASGEIATTPVATVPSVKERGDRRVESRITVFPLEVDEMARRYPEAGERERRWYPLATAIDAIDDDGMRLALTEFADTTDTD